MITPVFKPIGVHEDNWQATVGLFTGAMAKEVVVGTLNTLYTAENIQEEEFNPADFHLGDELLGAVDETWQSLKDTFSLSVLANPIEASKGDGEMATGGDGRDGREVWQRRCRIQLSDFRSAVCTVHLGDGGYRA